jgi:phospholipid transport system substrate-binding protein
VATIAEGSGIAMSTRWTALGTLVLTLVLAAPGPASAGPASETLRPAMDEVLRILQDETLKGRAQAPRRRAALRAVMHAFIDFPEAARRALGIHWQRRSEAERAEFVGLFRDLVTYSYIVTMEAYTGERILVEGETDHDGATFVSTRVVGTQGPPVPVEYRMHRRDGRWLVYDVVVEGVSLVANYRAQFNTVIRTASYEELVRRMRARVAELSKPPGAAHRRWFT